MIVAVIQCFGKEMRRLVQEGCVMELDLPTICCHQKPLGIWPVYIFFPLFFISNMAL